MKKVDPITVEVATRAEAQLRFTLTMAEGILGALGSSLDAAAYTAETPEVAKALRTAVKSLNKAYTTINKQRNATVSAIFKKARSKKATSSGLGDLRAQEMTSDSL